MSEDYYKPEFLKGSHPYSWHNFFDTCKFKSKEEAIHSLRLNPPAASQFRALGKKRLAEIYAYLGIEYPSNARNTQVCPHCGNLINFKRNPLIHKTWKATWKPIPYIPVRLP